MFLYLLAFQIPLPFRAHAIQNKICEINPFICTGYPIPREISIEWHFLRSTEFILEEESVELLLWFLCRREHMQQEACPSISQAIFLGTQCPCLPHGPSLPQERSSLPCFPFYSWHLASCVLICKSVSMEVGFPDCPLFLFYALLQEQVVSIPTSGLRPRTF